MLPGNVRSKRNMNRFTFLHSADLHLGSPFTGLALKDDAVARRFAAASRDAFTGLVTQAIAENVAFALIAGDVYDGDWKDTSIGLFFNKEVSRLARADIPVYLIRGNHDAESEITKAVALPGNVMEFSTRVAETHRIAALKVAIHGRSFPDRAVTENFAAAYPAPVAGWFNIGKLHTSCEGNAAHATYAPCTLAELVNRGYDYWALGHVHEQAVLHRDPWVVYSGNLQGRSVRECGPKGAMLVDVEDGRVKAARPLTLDRARWVDASVAVPEGAGLDQVLAQIGVALKAELAGAAGRLTALRVTLTGETALHGRLAARHKELADDVQALANHAYEDVWLESLKLATTEPAAGGAVESRPGGHDPAALLAGLGEDPDVRQRAVDMLALVRAKLPGALAEGALEDVDAVLAEAHLFSGPQEIVGRLPLHAEKKVGHRREGRAFASLIRTEDDMQPRIGVEGEALCRKGAVAFEVE